ncbi:MAG: hypothetical protein HN929_09820, partial [Chloroflexi bacterium]|nr:hypothetical protein [Chloroflexota bacterium]
MSTDDIKAPSIIKLKEIITSLGEELAGKADIPAFSDLQQSAQNADYAEGGIWDPNFTMEIGDPQLYWHNLVFTGFNPPETYNIPDQVSLGYFKFLPDLPGEIKLSSQAGSDYFRILSHPKQLYFPIEDAGWGNYLSKPGAGGQGLYSNEAQGILPRRDGDATNRQYFGQVPEGNRITFGFPNGWQDSTTPAQALYGSWRGRYQQNTTFAIINHDRTDYNTNGIPDPTTVGIPKAAATAKKYLQFASNLINGLRMRHAMIGPWGGTDADPEQNWITSFAPWSCDQAGTARSDVYIADWLEQIENTPEDIRASWASRLIIPDKLEGLNGKTVQHRRGAFARGLDTQGLKLITIDDDSEAASNWATSLGANAQTTDNPFHFADSYLPGEWGTDHVLGNPVIDALSLTIDIPDNPSFPIGFTHPSYIPSISSHPDNRENNPLKDFLPVDVGGGTMRGRYTSTPGQPSPFGVLDAKPVASLLHGNKSMKLLVEELYGQWQSARLIFAQSRFKASSCCQENCEGGDTTGEVADIEDEDVEAAAAREQLSEQADAIVAMAFSSPLEATFREQCYLLSDIFNLAGKRPTDSKPLPYIPPDDGIATNASIEVNGTPFGFMNMLTGDPKMYPLMQAHHSQLSALQPTIRLFKVTDKTVNGNRSQHEQEFNFDSHEKNYKETTTAT